LCIGLLQAAAPKTVAFTATLKLWMVSGKSKGPGNEGGVGGVGGWQWQQRVLLQSLKLWIVRGRSICPNS